MSVKLLLLKSGEEVITEVQELMDPETKEPIGFRLHKPFRCQGTKIQFIFNRC